MSIELEDLPDFCARTKFTEWKCPDNKEGLVARGVVLLLRNHKTGEIYTLREQCDKDWIGREADSISLISETTRAGDELHDAEIPIENLIGALGEYPLIDGDVLRLSDDNSYLGVYPLAGKGEAHVFVVDIETDNRDFSGLSTLAGVTSNHEVKPYGWMTTDQFLDLEAGLVRKGMQELLAWAVGTENYGKFLERNVMDDVVLTDVAEMGSYAWAREESGLPDMAGEYYRR